MVDMNLRRREVTNTPWGLGITTLLIAAVGLYNLASASRPPASLWQMQALYLGFGVLVAVVIALLDTRLIRRGAVVLYVLNIAALIALKYFGHKAKGSLSWFQIGPLRAQPAEFMKIGMVLMLARYFHMHPKGLGQGYSLRELIVPGLTALVPIGLVLTQPDLGTALMMLFTALTVIFFAGLHKRVLWISLAVAAFGVLLLWNDYLRVQEEPRFTIIRHFLKGHQDARIAGWLDPTYDLRGTNYHGAQSRIAVGSGGVFGKGWKQGTQTGLRFLPEQHTDFIFSVFAEEQGFIRSLLLLVLYGVLIAFSLAVARTARDRYGVFMVVGITAMMFWQIFENIGMVTGLLPITGITLPLLSYGGSSLLSVLIGIGLIFNTAIRRDTFA